MNWPYVHLLLNHFPVVLAVAGAAGALLALVTRRRAVWLYTVVTLTAAGASAVPTFLSGKEAEEMVEDQPVISRHLLHDHEESGETALYVLVVSGAIAGYAWWLMARREGVMPPTWLGALVVLASLASAGFVAYAAGLGGNVAHGKNTLRSPPSLVPTPEARNATFRCPNGVELRATFIGESVKLVTPSDSVELPQVVSGSGARYSNGTLTFWNKGRGAFVTRHDSTIYDNCTVVREKEDDED